MDGGTLFLDEIGDLSPELQTKLLRVLQNKEIKRLGENTIRKVDVRILAATNHDLTELIRDGKFRQDLYYRLNVVKIQVPPLRERAEDIPALVNHFLKDEPVSAISRQALRRLMQYSWPGNVRELENILKRAVIMAANQQIELDDLSFENVLQNPAASLAEATLEEIKQYFIRERLDRFNGNKSQTARSLDISLRSLQQKCSEEGWT
jgi:Nif-specific regulatory protein